MKQPPWSLTLYSYCGGPKPLLSRIVLLGYNTLVLIQQSYISSFLSSILYRFFVVLSSYLPRPYMITDGRGLSLPIVLVCLSHSLSFSLSLVFFYFVFSLVFHHVLSLSCSIVFSIFLSYLSLSLSLSSLLCIYNYIHTLHIPNILKVEDKPFIWLWPTSM